MNKEETLYLILVRMKLIDSGFSHHITGDIDKFNSLEEYGGGFVKVGNDVPCPMKGENSLTLNEKIRFDDSY